MCYARSRDIYNVDSDKNVCPFSLDEAGDKEQI